MPPGLGIECQIAHNSAIGWPTSSCSEHLASTSFELMFFDHSADLGLRTQLPEYLGFSCTRAQAELKRRVAYRMAEVKHAGRAICNISQYRTMHSGQYSG